MNEELQSTNEELESSREELQSLNEELTTVNNQLEEKVQELEAINDDLNNLLTSTDIATVFLNTDMVIRRFTPAVTSLLKLIPSDVGRPFQDISPRFTDPDLLGDAEEVLERLMPSEKEISDERGYWYIRRITPYRTAASRIDGVVITFTDVTAMRRSGERARVREAQQAVIARLGREALERTSVERLFVLAAEQIVEVLPVEYCDILEQRPDIEELKLTAGVGWDEGLVGSTVIDAGRGSHAGFTLKVKEPVVVEEFAEERRFTPSNLLVSHEVRSGLSVIIGDRERPFGVLGAHSRQSGQYTVDDINFLQSVANVLWSALERSQYEEALEQGEERFRLSLEGGEMGAWDWNLRTDEVTWSERIFELLGLDSDEGRPSLEALFERIHQADREAVEGAVKRSIEQAERFNEEFRVVNSGGERRWLASVAVPSLDSEGEVVRLIGVSFDITSRKQWERENHRRKEEFEALVELSPDIILRLDPAGRILYVNPALHGVSGLDPEALEGRTVIETHLFDEEPGRIERLLERVLFEGSSAEATATFRTPRGGALYQFRFVPQHNRRGEVEAVIAVGRDLSALMEKERVLTQLTEALEDKVAERTAAAERQAAQLRQLAAQLTQTERRERKRLANTLHDELQQLLLAGKMNLLRLAKKAPPNTARFDKVVDLLTRSIELSRSLAVELSPPVLSYGGLVEVIQWAARRVSDQQGLKVEVEVEGTQQPIDENSRIALFEAVRECLLNTVKHAEVDEAEVKIVYLEEAVEVHILDRGVGFDLRVFDEAAGSGQRGLGLFNIKERITALGGNMIMESVPNDGAHFTIRVPIVSIEEEATQLDEPSSSPRRPSVIPQTNGLQVLVVDDHKVVRQGLVSLLEGHERFQVIGEASDGEEAVQMAKRLRPDLVIMDVGLPRLNGVEATRRIKAWSDKVKVIGLSLHNEVELQRSLIDAGAEAFLCKEESSKRLLSTIAEVCGTAEKEELL